MTRDTVLAGWGRFVHRHRWLVLAGGAACVAASIAAHGRGGPLGAGRIEATESTRALRMMEQAVGRGGDAAFAVLLGSRTLENDDADFTTALTAALAPLRADPRVASVLAPDTAPPDVAATLRSADGHGAIALVTLREGLPAAAGQYPALRDLVRTDRLDATFTGPLPFLHDLHATLAADGHRALLLALPLALVVLLAACASIVAALVPVVVAAAAVTGGAAIVLSLGQGPAMTPWVLDVALLLGLVVAVQHALIVVSRFRDELAAGRDGETALAVAMATAGRAVVFSALAVLAALSGLLVFRGSPLEALGMAGAVMVGVAAVHALTLAPALCAVAGHGLDALPVPFGGSAAARWRGLATWATAHPALVLLPTVGVLLAAALPLRQLDVATADVRALPRGTEARRGDGVLQRQFPALSPTAVVGVVRFPDAAPTPERVAALWDLHRRLAALPDVIAVESPFSADPALGKDAWVALLTGPADARPPAVRDGLARTMGGDVVLLTALTRQSARSDEARALVRAMRQQRHVADGLLRVAGRTADDMDAAQYVRRRAPRALAWMTVATFVVLLLQLGAIPLSLAAVSTGLLSAGGVLGALVWVFQDGHLRTVLGAFDPAPLDPSLPVALGCAAFGLAMAGQALLLSRVREEHGRTGDAARAVVEGVGRSGRALTGAAAAAVTVCAAFALTDLVVLKAVAVGLGLAVALGATVVRGLLLPAVLGVLGAACWWAPGPLARVGAGAGLREADA